MPTFEIWAEGYLATGMEGMPAGARKLGEADASDFASACTRFFTDKPDFDPTRLTYWGCNLFDNEADARVRFG